VERICVLGDVEVLLDFTPRVRKERPVGTDSAAIFIRLCAPFLLEHDHASLFWKNLRGLVSLKFWIEENVDSAKNQTPHLEKRAK
jgi:hypothetical protein